VIIQIFYVSGGNLVMRRWSNFVSNDCFWKYWSRSTGVWNLPTLFKSM